MKCKVVACKKQTGPRCGKFCDLHHSVSCQKHRPPNWGKKGKPLVVTSRNVGKIFDAISKKMDDMAHAVTLAIDFDIFFPFSLECDAAIKEALRLNTRAGRVLSTVDRRTRGCKYYEKKRLEAWERFKQPAKKNGRVYGKN